MVLSRSWKKFGRQSRHQTRKKKAASSDEAVEQEDGKTLPLDRSSRLVSLFDWLLFLQIGQRDPLLGPKIGNTMKFGE